MPRLAVWYYDCYTPNTCLISNGFASMGFSIPGAFAAKLLNPDKKVLAGAMHCKGYRVEKATDLIPTLEEAFRQTVPSVIVVPVDYSENMKLSAHLKKVYQQSND